MALYRKKPVVIEAEQWWPDQRPWPVGVDAETRSTCSDPECGDSTWDHYCDIGKATGFGVIVTPDGAMRVTPGDWIITGVQGEKYPCKPEIFAATYEPAEETPPG